jgi:hypothetical protein
MSSKNIARLGQIENSNLEEMETGLVSIVPKPDSYVRPLRRKVAYDWLNIYILLRRLNNQNKSAGKPGLLSVHEHKSLFMFAKCRIHNCSGAVAFCVKDRGVRCVEEGVTHTHTHTNTHINTLPIITEHHTAAVLNAISQLCDGIQCRLTVRTGGSAKGEILAVQLGKEQTDRVENRKMVNKKRT